MSKIIAVVGATGLQGSGIISASLQEGSWEVRGLTRNVESEKAKALRSQGVEIVKADASDEESLVKAFKGATAIYGMTQFWEYILQHGAEKAGETEYDQGVKLANAASRTPSLEHYIFATLPSASKATNGKIHVPHMDYKANVDVYIKEKLPELAKKTTFVWHGMYASNLAFFPNMKPTFFPAAGKHIIIFPTPSSTMLPFVGDVSQNTGAFVRGILDHPNISKGSYILISSDYMSLGDYVQMWSKVTGKSCVYLKCSAEEYEALWPVFGDELTAQLSFNEVTPDWWLYGTEKVKHIEKEDLGINGGLIGAEQVLKSLLPQWE